MLTENPGYTMPQLAERLSVSRETVAARLKKLKEAGLIERVGIRPQRILLEVTEIKKNALVTS